MMTVTESHQRGKGRGGERERVKISLGYLQQPFSFGGGKNQLCSCADAVCAAKK